MFDLHRGVWRKRELARTPLDLGALRYANPREADHLIERHHIEKRPSILTPKVIIDALRASTNRTPATKGKGLAATAA
jgi:hypothetical protein